VKQPILLSGCTCLAASTAKMGKDERCERSYKQSLELLTPRAVFILGEFERLTG
jgi:hypothetical protein